ncbi:hypothetical protein GCM10009560_15040 [Nonomuraea longicatena]|uniref:Uncharacterized protein n=1 Tax=Nonomuraea longicatena TaxID=83682 RepID=A0ABP3ZA07_9ACTN
MDPVGEYESWPLCEPHAAALPAKDPTAPLAVVAALWLGWTERNWPDTRSNFPQDYRDPLRSGSGGLAGCPGEHRLGPDRPVLPPGGAQHPGAGGRHRGVAGGRHHLVDEREFLQWVRLKRAPSMSSAPIPQLRRHRRGG